jgi:hypothetical protein
MSQEMIKILAFLINKMTNDGGCSLGGRHSWQFLSYMAKGGGAVEGPVGTL